MQNYKPYNELINTSLIPTHLLLNEWILNILKQLKHFNKHKMSMTLSNIVEVTLTFPDEHDQDKLKSTRM